MPLERMDGRGFLDKHIALFEASLLATEGCLESTVRAEYLCHSLVNAFRHAATNG